MYYSCIYIDMTEMPHKTMTYLRMYCNSFPIVLNINHSFSNFKETLTHFNNMWIKKNKKSLGGSLHHLHVLHFILLRLHLLYDNIHRLHSFILYPNSPLLATFYTLSFLDYIHEATHLLTLLTYITYSTYNIYIQHTYIHTCCCCIKYINGVRIDGTYVV